LKTDIFLTLYNDEENYSLVIDGDEHSIWVYVLNSEGDIYFEGFLCSRGTVAKTSEEIEEYISQNFQPPLLKEFENKFSIQQNIDKENIEIKWKNGQIHISINQVEFLKMDILNKTAYSKSISSEGPYGIPLIEKSK
jgi:HSP20 family molecular chaperone IbpA